MSESEFAERFWAKVDRSQGPDLCWPWLGSLNNGYGVTSDIRGKECGSHRVALSLASGQPIPRGKVVRHLVCDNPRCVNPAHLAVGSHADNVADRVAKGRSATGVQHGRAKLTEAKARAIRDLRQAGWFHREIAELFEVDDRCVRKVLSGETWSRSPRSPHEDQFSRRKPLHPEGFEPPTFGSVD